MPDSEKTPLLLAHREHPDGLAPERVYLRLGVWAAHAGFPPANRSVDYNPRTFQAAVSHAPSGLLVAHGLSRKDAMDFCRKLYAGFPEFAKDAPHRGEYATASDPAWHDLEKFVRENQPKRGGG